MVAKTLVRGEGRKQCAVTGWGWSKQRLAGFKSWGMQVCPELTRDSCWQGFLWESKGEMWGCTRGPV